jgi:hypothetical protein
MYGLTPKLTLIGTISASNHHLKKIPSVVVPNYQHHHSSVSTSSTVAEPNPILLNGVHIYGKYRFLTRDKQHDHFRMALYGEWSYSLQAYAEAEPVLMGDNSGLGSGIIATKLYKKLAISATTGYIHPFKYRQEQDGIEFQSGDAWVYNLAIGYLLLPRTYKSYKDLNLNLYVELFGKSYGQAFYQAYGNSIDLSDKPNLKKGSYTEIRPAVQCIIHSNTRLDFSMAFPFYNVSKVRVYPVYLLSLQRYFYSRDKKLN